MIESTPLFGDLPEQAPPATLYADRHALQPCARCGGTGTETCPYPRWHHRWLTWDPECRRCKGGGKVLIYVGAVHDV